jgi:hypothetical protein
MVKTAAYSRGDTKAFMAPKRYNFVRRVLSLGRGSAMTEATNPNWEGSICGQCGERIAEPRNIDAAQRKPCPRCGSLTRRIVAEQRFQVEILGAVTATATAQIEIIPSYPRVLLNLARSLIDQGELRFGIAVIVAHMACEIATERSLSIAFANRGLQYLENPVTDFLNGYNLANDKIRRLYTALTGDEVQKAAFWDKFKKASQQRNKVIHGGVIVTQTDAEEAYRAADDLLVHMGYTR